MTGRREALSQARLVAALESIDAGFLMFDADDRLSMCNGRVRDDFAAIADLLEPGARFATIAEALVGQGIVDAGDRGAEDCLRGLFTYHNNPRGAHELLLADGRWLRLCEHATDDGGTVAIYADISDVKAREIRLREGERRYQKLTEIGVALSAEKNINRLLELILLEAKSIANADGGTVYLRVEDNELPRRRDDKRIDPRAGGDRRVSRGRRSEDDRRWMGRADAMSRREPTNRRSGGDRRMRTDRLVFAIMRNDSLGVAFGGTTGEEVPYTPLPIYDHNTGKANASNVATLAAITGIPINIPDAYASTEFDFAGTKAFDAEAGYRSVSFLTIPMKNKGGEVTGVLQLINARDATTGEIVPFYPEHQQAIEALASQAAVAIDNKMLLEEQKNLLDAFIQVIAGAIDEKSPYTGGHCERVPELTEMLAEAACAAEHGPLRNFNLDDEERYELHIAAWLHDCGKVTTPDYVVDKATKLETVADGIELVQTRFEVLKREIEIAYRERLSDGTADGETLDAGFRAEIAQLDADCAFLAEVNIGGEFMDEDKKERVRRIARRRWRGPDGTMRDLLDADEIDRLCVGRGTLTPEEREVVDDHIVVTISMLEQLPFPKGLARVPEYAGGHHEKMDGTGYPRGLTREQMSVPARMMAIADIFEALTAGDRPYKKAKSLSESMAIMAKMRDGNHIDPDLFELFIESGVYRKYAERFLDPAQVDEVDEAALLVRPAAMDGTNANDTGRTARRGR